MQEQLQWPVVPVTIRGAYELFPLKSYFNDCGKVTCRGARLFGLGSSGIALTLCSLAHFLAAV